jgi:hypothetical protein
MPCSPVLKTEKCLDLMNGMGRFQELNWGNTIAFWPVSGAIIRRFRENQKFLLPNTNCFNGPFGEWLSIETHD